MMVGTESQRVACIASQLIGGKLHCSIFHRDHRQELAIGDELHGDPKFEHRNPLEDRWAWMQLTKLALTERKGEVFLP